MTYPEVVERLRGRPAMPLFATTTWDEPLQAAIAARLPIVSFLAARSRIRRRRLASSPAWALERRLRRRAPPLPGPEDPDRQTTGTRSATAARAIRAQAWRVTWATPATGFGRWVPTPPTSRSTGWRATSSAVRGLGFGGPPRRSRSSSSAARGTRSCWSTGSRRPSAGRCRIRRGRSWRRSSGARSTSSPTGVPRARTGRIGGGQRVDVLSINPGRRAERGEPHFNQGGTHGERAGPWKIRRRRHRRAKRLRQKAKAAGTTPQAGRKS